MFVTIDQKRIGIEAGIQYANKGVRTKFLDVHNDQNPSIVQKKAFVFTSHYIDLPLKINFTWGEKRLRFCTSAGITPNIWFRETLTTKEKFENGDVKRKTEKYPSDHFRRFNISPTVSAGINYKISDRFLLKMEPTFRYELLDLLDSDRAVVKQYLWSIGLNTSCYFSLK